MYQAWKRHKTPGSHSIGQNSILWLQLTAGRLENVVSLYVQEKEENMGVSGKPSLDVWGLRLWLTMIRLLV